MLFRTVGSFSITSHLSHAVKLRLHSANNYRITFYIGVISNLTERIGKHANGLSGKFTKKYNLTDLDYFEQFTDIKFATVREKQLKNWHHDWKVNLIKEKNPTLATN